MRRLLTAIYVLAAMFAATAVGGLYVIWYGFSGHGLVQIPELESHRRLQREVLRTLDGGGRLEVDLATYNSDDFEVVCSMDEAVNLDRALARLLWRFDIADTGRNHALASQSALAFARRGHSQFVIFPVARAHLEPRMRCLPIEDARLTIWRDHRGTERLRLHSDPTTGH